MTEELIEQKAEEYAENLYKQKINYADYSGEGLVYYRSSDIKEAFLAGLKAGRPQWHDLEKDPTDEPKKDGEYLVQVMCIMFNDVEYCVGRYRKEENRWEGEQLRGLLVTKWKEIE